MNASRRRIGAIGAGGMGVGHIRAIVASPHWDLAYVCDLSEERLALAKTIAPAARLTRDAEDLFRDRSVEVVTINTLSNARPRLVQRALEARKHILCEKPLAPTADEAQRVADMVRGTDRLATVDLFNRNARYLHDAMAFIEEGQIGELALIRLNHCTPGGTPAQRSRDTHSAVEGHVLHDCGMHYVDVARWFARSEFAEFTARAIRFWGSEFDLHFSVYGAFQNNIQFEIHNSFCYTSLAKDRRNYSGQEFIGSHGVITITHDFRNVTIRMNGHTRTVEAVKPYGGKKLNIYYDQFARALDTGDYGPLPRLEDAVVASRVAQAMVNQALARPIPSFGRSCPDGACTVTPP